MEAVEQLADPKYGKLDLATVQLLKTFETEYFRENLPVPFHGLTSYPIKVRDFEIFSSCAECLTLNKNETPRGIAMSHLDYLLSKMQDKQKQDEAQLMSFKFQKILELVFHIQNGMKCKKCGKVITYNSEQFSNYIKGLQETTQKIQQQQDQDQENSFSLEEIQIPKLQCLDCQGEEFIEMIKIQQDEKTKKKQLVIDEKIITSKDFNLLRQLIMYQNFSDYADDSWVDPEIKKDHDEKMRIEAQKNDVHATIEKKVICLAATTSYKIAEIYDMPIREFQQLLSTIDDLINYKIMKQATMSGFVSLPKGKSLEHWIYKPNKDMYGDAYKSVDEIKQSVSDL